MAKHRTLKIYQKMVLTNKWRRTYKSIPQIQLQGKWLKDLGFKEGKHIKIKQQPKKLIITIDE